MSPPCSTLLLVLLLISSTAIIIITAENRIDDIHSPLSSLSYMLWNADSDERISRLSAPSATSATTIDLCEVGDSSLSIQVTARDVGRFGMMNFKLRYSGNGTVVYKNLDEQPPFMMGGNSRYPLDVYSVDQLRIPGEYRLIVIPTKGKKEMIPLTVLECQKKELEKPVVIASQQQQQQQCQYRRLDFNDDDKKDLADSTDFISDQFLDQYGVTIQATTRTGGKMIDDDNNNNNNNVARLFDSSNPTPQDLDLGSPNVNCPPSNIGGGGGGPGIGRGGGMDSPYPNCHHLGNVLIIQQEEEDDDDGSSSSSLTSTAPNDNRRGGTIVFLFDHPVSFKEVALLDTETSATVEITDVNGNTTIYKGPEMDDNGFYNLMVDVMDGIRVDITLVESGAIAHIGYIDCYYNN